MSLNLIQYSNFENGAEELRAKLQDNKDVFIPSFVITGHQDTNDCLVDKFAANGSIVANVHFKKTIQLVQMVYELVKDNHQETKFLDKDLSSWLIFNALHGFGNETLTQYYREDNLKRFTFSVEVAQLFEKYQLYCPELLEAWNGNQTATNNNQEEWQKELWRTISQNNGYIDLIQMYSIIEEKLKSEENKEKLKNKIHSLHCFGSLPFTPKFVSFLKSLSDIIPVNVFTPKWIHNQQYGMLKRLGIYATYEKEMLGEVLGQNENLPPAPYNLLQYIQNKIANGNGGEVEGTKFKDDAISVHSHYTINREVEGLYHYIIKQISEHEDLGFRDICVVCPDITQYASAIKTHFNKKECQIPYLFYDDSHHFHQSPYHALEALFSMEEDEFTSIKILSLLDFAYIRQKFGITHDVSLLKRILTKANIRHHYTGDRTNETRYVSWEYGFKRLMYGMCLQPGIENVVEFDGDTFYPVDAFEEDEAEQIVLLHHFVSTLNQWFERRVMVKTLTDWAAFVGEETVEMLLDANEYDLKMLQDIVQTLSLACNNATVVDFRTVRHFLLSSLAQLHVPSKQGYGGVRFISPNSFLSAPARIYAFLGMNGDSFPRKSFQYSFDLCSENRISKSNLDKHHFLNLILSAKDKLYISYIGRQIENNKVQPPSTLVEELFANIKSVSGDDYSLDQFIIDHPLHSFSGRYRQDDRLVKYVSQNQAESTRSKNNDQNANPIELFEKDEQGKTIIPLHLLQSFLQDPVKHYYEKVLGIYYKDREEEPEDCETISLDNLQKWKIKDSILKKLLNGEGLDIQQITDELKRKGELPLKNLGVVEFNKLHQSIEELINNHLADFVGEAVEEVEVDVVVGEYRIKGTVASFYEAMNTYLFVTTSKHDRNEKKPKYLIQAYVNYQLLKFQSNPQNHLRYVTNNGPANLDLLNGQNINEAKECICKLCKLLIEGTENLIPYASIFTKENNLTEDNVAETVRKKINDEFTYDISEYFKNFDSKTEWKDDEIDKFISMYSALRSIFVLFK